MAGKILQFSILKKNKSYATFFFPKDKEMITNQTLQLIDDQSEHTNEEVY